MDSAVALCPSARKALTIMFAEYPFAHASSNAFLSLSVSVLIVICHEQYLLYGFCFEASSSIAFSKLIPTSVHSLTQSVNEQFRLMLRSAFPWRRETYAFFLGAFFTDAFAIFLISTSAQLQISKTAVFQKIEIIMI